MNIEIKDRTIKVDMVKYLEDCIEMFGEDVIMLVTYPATKQFFEVKEDAEQMSEKKGELFHSVVETFLFITKRSRPDLEKAMGFLTTRVSKSDVDNWEKWRSILRFVHCTLKGKNILERQL